MARATADCKCEKCGVYFTKTKKCYNRSEANKWEEWAEQNYTLCTECYRAEQVEKAREETSDLPELTGSDKQIAWATQIRADRIARLNKILEINTPKPGTEEIINKAVADFRAIVDSKYWIDTRDENILKLMDALVKQREEQK